MKKAITEKRAAQTIYVFLFLFLFSTINAMIINILAVRPAFTVDYYMHINQALHFRQIFAMDFQTFLSSAPLPRSFIQSAWHISFLPFYAIFNSLGLPAWDSARLAASSLHAIFNLLAILAISTVLAKFLKARFRSYIYPLIATMILFVGPLYIPAVNERYYLGQLFSGVWHNPTSQSLKFLIIIAFFLFLHLSENRERLKAEAMFSKLRISKLNFWFIVLSFLLLLSIPFKISLALVFIPALFIFCVIDIIKTKWGSFDFCFKTGLCVLPSTILVLINSVILRGTDETAIIFYPMHVWNIFSPNPLLSVLISLPFPLLVICVYFKQFLKSKMMMFSLITLVVAILQFVFLAVYPRAYFGDFSWGMHLSTLLFFVTSFIFFAQNISNNTDISIKQKLAKPIGYSILFIQFMYGIVYYFGIVSANTGISGGWIG